MKTTPIGVLIKKKVVGYKEPIKLIQQVFQ
jgi:hypothetical protein